MSFKFKLEKFVADFGFYIFILFSTLVLSAFESFFPSRPVLKNFYAKALLLEEILQEKLKDFLQSKNFDFKNITVLLLGFIVFIIILASMLLFLISVYKKIKAKPLVITAQYSPYPLWRLKDFFKIVIWVFFWMQILILGNQFYRLINKNFSEAEYLSSSLSVSLLFDSIIFLLIYYWLRKYCRQNLSALGIYKNRIIFDFKKAIYYYLSFLPILIFLIFMSGTYLEKYQRPVAPQPLFYFLLFEKNSGRLGLAIVFIVFFGPIVEELFFRGLFYNSLKKSIGIFQAMLISSLLFSLLHINLIGFLPILGLALLFVYLYEKTGSLSIPIFIHALHNGFLILVIFLFRAILGI